MRTRLLVVLVLAMLAPPLPVDAGGTAVVRDWDLPASRSSRFFTVSLLGEPGRTVRLRAGDRVSAPVRLDGAMQRAGISLGSGARAVRLESVDGAGAVRAEAAGVTAVSASQTTVVPGTRRVTLNGQPFVGTGYVYWPLEIGLQWPASTWANPTSCQQDARLMGAAGVTLLRIPYEDHEAAVHDRYTACLDAFHANGISVLWLFGPPSQLEHIEGDSNYVELYAKKVEDAVAAVGGHPATAFWTIGNEIERSNPGELWLGNKTTGAPAMLETLIQRGKAADGGRHIWGTTICCPLLGPGGWLANANVPSLDFWGVNAYGQPHSPGTWFSDLNAADPRPKVITETGADRYHCIQGTVTVDRIVQSCRTSYQDPSAHSGEHQVKQRDWNLRVWDNIAPNLATPSSPNGAVFGATFFMWSDLWWFSLGGLLPLPPVSHEVVGANQWPAPDGIINLEWHGVSAAQLPGATEPRPTSLAFDALAGRWAATAPPTISNVTVTVSGASITMTWTTSEPASSEVQAGANLELNRDGGEMLADSTVFRQVAYDGSPVTSHAVTITAPTLDPGLCQKVIARSFTADGRSATTRPYIAGCPSTGRTGEA